ncbi:MAG: hypothetical protein ACTSWL_04485, partial [Promethearchaeota archaeon]
LSSRCKTFGFVAFSYFFSGMSLIINFANKAVKGKKIKPNPTLKIVCELAICLGTTALLAAISERKGSATGEIERTRSAKVGIQKE